MFRTNGLSIYEFLIMFMFSLIVVPIDFNCSKIFEAKYHIIRLFKKPFYRSFVILAANSQQNPSSFKIFKPKTEIIIGFT